MNSPALIPEQSSGFFGIGKKVVSHEFARERMPLLQHYLGILLSDIRIHNSKKMQSWLGFRMKTNILLFLIRNRRGSRSPPC